MVTQVISLLERPVTVQTHACATGPLYDFHSEVLKTLYTIYHDFCTINYKDLSIIYNNKTCHNLIINIAQKYDVY